ncbi:amidase [Caenimonas koreensis]|uniref:Amidase n=1 Tax=Caenimonas koreensis DSM 17982 TaxID=1121255 RepID=A0A844B994_9BURK|nr:amidase [Caenimonas koreensis]MRD48169.1 amidase [Caenimonas koreensis DSM 17982]
MTQPPRPDLTATRERLLAGQTTVAAELETSLAIAQSPANRHTFLAPDFDSVRHAGAQPHLHHSRLAGLAVSIKDLFDIAGQPSLAGSKVLAAAPPAASDCPAVAALKAGGGIVLGRTNMTEFAFSGIGVNPHYGTPVNPADTQTPRIPGGSSSGAAVSVATGAAFIGLGSDTGGSIRIPAALCGIVGFKNTARLTSTQGAVPLSTTLDTACAMTRSVRDAILAHEVLANRTVARSSTPLSGMRLAVARTTMLDSLDAQVATAFEQTLRTLRDAGASIQEIPLDAIRDLGALQATGGFTGAEAYAWHRLLLARAAEDYDQRVRVRLERGANMKAFEYLELAQARQSWIARVGEALAGFDAVLSPTVPIVAPPIDQVRPAKPGEDAKALDDEFFRVNALLLRNTSVVNMLDGCAISIPCHAPGTLPVGLMIWQQSMHDDTVLQVALQAEAALAKALRA